MRRLWDLRSVDRRVLRGVVLPHCGGGWRIAGHGVAGVWTVFQGDFTVLVEFLELRPPILEPDFDLGEKKQCKH